MRAFAAVVLICLAGACARLGEPSAAPSPERSGPRVWYDERVGVCVEDVSPSGRRACSGPVDREGPVTVTLTEENGLCLERDCTGAVPMPLGDPYGIAFDEDYGLCLADDRWAACTDLPPELREEEGVPCLHDPTWPGYGTAEEAEKGAEIADRRPECVVGVIPYWDGVPPSPPTSTYTGGPKRPPGDD